MNHPLKRAVLPLLLLVGQLQLSTAMAQSSAFTYQGQLNDSGSVVTGLYDFRFKLYADSLATTQIGDNYTNNAVGVTNGLFSTTLDFGSGNFDGTSRWLAVEVKTNGTDNYTALTPLQLITPTPYAIFAGSASNLNGTLPVTQLSGTLAATQLPASTVTNNATGLTLTGTFTGDGSSLTNVNAATLGGLSPTSFWRTNGNTGANPTNGAFIGTTDNLPMEFKVNSTRALRLEYAANGTFGNIPNVIGGYAGNRVSNNCAGAFIGGGGTTTAPNIVGDSLASVLGGYGNQANGFCSTAMGCVSIANGFYSTAIGFTSIASGAYSTAMGWNTFSGGYASTTMGYGNFATGYVATAMGYVNTATGYVATAMGSHTTAGGMYSTAMGYYTVASNISCTAMGNATVASGSYSTAMGSSTLASGPYSTAMGSGTIASGTYSTAVGYSNTASGSCSTTMGSYNTASGNYCTAMGGGNLATYMFATSIGFSNTASGYGSTAMGVRSIASGYGSTAMGAFATASGDNSTAMGTVTTASGTFSTAMGFYANATNSGSLVWGDASTNTPITSTNVNSVTFRAAGGYRLFSNTNTTAGTYLAPGGTAWAVISDRNAKKDFAAINPVDILEKLAAMPVTQWHYKWETADTTPHIGPMAQDFKHAFYPGSDDKSITTLEADGVTFAAIQGLNQKLETQQHQLAQKDAELADLKARLERLECALEKISK